MFGNVESKYEEKTFARGDVLFREGDKVKSLYLLKSGSAILVSNNNDRFVPLYYLDDRGLIGEDCVFKKDSTANYSVVFLNATKVVEIPKSDIMSYINDSADWIKTILTDMADKCSKTSSLIVEHKIIDEKLSGNKSFGDEMEATIRKALNPK